MKTRENSLSGFSKKANQFVKSLALSASILPPSTEFSPRQHEVSRVKHSHIHHE